MALTGTVAVTICKSFVDFSLKQRKIERKVIQRGYFVLIRSCALHGGHPG